MDWFATISLALGSAWTSGINLYATVTVLGLLQKFGATKLPLGLTVLDSWWVIGIAGFLFLVEFFADKIPYVDSVWDVIHTFIRVPAGAIVAYAATNEMGSDDRSGRDITRRRAGTIVAWDEGCLEGDSQSFSRTGFKLGFIGR
jgi:hypothetical protein